MRIRTYSRAFSRAATAATICIAGVVALPATAHAFFYFQTGCQTTCQPTDLTAGPDGNMWFTDSADDLVGRVTTATGAIDTFPVAGAPDAIITGPDGNLWVAQSGSGQVAIVNTAGTVVQEVTVTGDGTASGPTRLAAGLAVGPAGTVWYVDGDEVGSIVNVAPLTATLAVKLSGISLGDIVKGPDGGMWVTELNTGNLADIIAVVPTAHTVQGTALGPGARITVGPDGNLWFTDPSANDIGEVNMSSGDAITLYPIPTPASSPSAIAAGSDGNIWFIESADGSIGRFSPSDPKAITEFPPLSEGADAIAPDLLGNLWVADNTAGVITLVEPSGRYVEQVYHDLLGRAPDPAGLAFWVNALESGSDPSQVATSFTGSYEYRAINVTADYNLLLGRGPDAAGLAYWVGYIGSGATYEDLEASLIASDEYYNVRGGGTVDGFVTAVYHDILNRAPDGAGLQYWAGQISGGVPRYVISESFSHTTEVLQNRVMADYQALLRRPADAAGVAYWVGLLQTGTRDEQLVADLTGSDEYILYSAVHPTP